MCRLASFPPYFPRDKALEILLEFENANTDGVGSVYVKKGEFGVEKCPDSLSNVLKGGYPFLGHMPYNGWTVAHLRAASHGKNTMENTHPFIVGNWAIAHNGIFSEHNIVKLALGDRIKFKGETDTEAAIHLINIAGPKKFAREVTQSGVFLCLNKNGSLYAIKTGFSSDLVLYQRNNGTTLIASELEMESYKRQVESLIGWYKFNKHGKYVAHRETDRFASNRTTTYTYTPTKSIRGRAPKTHGIYVPSWTPTACTPTSCYPKNKTIKLPLKHFYESESWD